MRKIISIILIAVLLLAAAIGAVLLIQHLQSGFTHTDRTVDVINADGFNEKFGVEKVRKVSYDYDIKVSENGETAKVTLNMKVFIGNSSYVASAEGEVIAHSLPSGDVLWEGSIDGEMSVGDKTEKLIVGFTKVESNGDVSISVTFSGGQTCGFIFGDYIMEGEVLEYFENKVS